MSVARRQDFVALEHPGLSVVRQCELLGVSRSGFYYEPVGESEDPSPDACDRRAVHGDAVLRITAGHRPGNSNPNPAFQFDRRACFPVPTWR
jgi:hypothetical protein